MSDAEGGAPAAAGAPEGTPAQDLYREKPVSKVVRVMTVMAYLTSVSFAAILLSVYYICIWKSPEAPKGDDPYLLARQGTHRDYETAYYADLPANLTGRGDTAVRENSTETTPDGLNYNATRTDAPSTIALDASASDTSEPTLTPDTSAQTSTDTSAQTSTDTSAPRLPANLTVDT